MFKFRGFGKSVVFGLVAYFGLIEVAQAQNPDPYEQYYGPRPTPYSSTYSQPYNQPTYQPPQQYGQQPYYGGYQQPQYGGQPAQPADPYQQPRRTQQVSAPGSPQTNGQPSEPAVGFDVYVGVGVSATFFSEEPDYTTEVGANVFAAVQARINSERMAFLIGLEASYQYLGELEIDYSHFKESFTTHSFGVSLRPGIAFGDKFNLYARLGMHYWDLENDSPWGTLVADDFDLMYGAGMEFNMTEHLGLRVDWTEFEIGGSQGFGAVTSALYYRF